MDAKPEKVTKTHLRVPTLYTYFTIRQDYTCLGVSLYYYQTSYFFRHTPTLWRITRNSTKEVKTVEITNCLVPHSKIYNNK